MNQSFAGTINYQGDLNSAQLDAVTSAPSPILVIAGAGSGKTRTVVYRVAWLVESGIDPSSILLLTFTRKAAEEMLTRASHLLDGRVSRVSGGTFHSTANLLLRRYAGLLGFDRGFSIMDRGDTVEAIDHARKALDPAGNTRKGFPKARTIAEIISLSAGTNTSIGETIEMRHPHLVSAIPDVVKIHALYEEHKRPNNLMDYDDLLINAIRVMEKDELVRTEISRRWQHILVDEYQDTNYLQARMLRLLASEHDNVMAVGDDSQSIYSFRGADFRNIIEFPTLFPGARIIKLEENYRSTAPILAVTNSIIERATVGYPKRLYTRKNGGPLPLAARPPTERDQSRFVVMCVKELQEHHIPLREVAILFRAAFHSFDLEGELTRSNIPYVKYGGFKFLESLHIKDVLAHLKVLHNPRERLSWARILRIIPGIGPKTALDLARKIAEVGIPPDPSLLVSRKRKYWQPFDDLMGLINKLKNERGPISQKVEQINRYYFPFLQNNYDNYPKRMRDLENLADLTAPYRSLNRFLSDMALEPPDDERSGSDPRSNSLVLSTIHSSKGLEWHTVILIWAAEGRIPSPMALDSPEEMEEERRLLYVATTRAKHNLVVVAPQTVMDRSRSVVPVTFSRFLGDVSHDFFRTYPPGS
jgi:DNA helicase-2/ATP-dependent DNA helicase PcrA